MASKESSIQSGENASVQIEKDVEQATYAETRARFDTDYHKLIDELDTEIEEIDGIDTTALTDEFYSPLGNWEMKLRIEEEGSKGEKLFLEKARLKGKANQAEFCVKETPLQHLTPDRNFSLDETLPADEYVQAHIDALNDCEQRRRNEGSWKFPYASGIILRRKVLENVTKPYITALQGSEEEDVNLRKIIEDADLDDSRLDG